MAGGTGRHPCTQLCLEAIGRYVRLGDLLIDIGTGSGILSAAALLVGAGRVVACDIDPQAVRIASERTDDPHLFIGSADPIRSAPADVVVAHIDAATLASIAPQPAPVVKPTSTLLLSWFPGSDR